MEPKDLKNSEELKSPEKEDLKKENVENSASGAVEQGGPNKEATPSKAKAEKEKDAATKNEKSEIQEEPETKPQSKNAPVANEDVSEVKEEMVAEKPEKEEVKTEEELPVKEEKPEKEKSTETVAGETIAEAPDKKEVDATAESVEEVEETDEKKVEQEQEETEDVASMDDKEEPVEEAKSDEEKPKEKLEEVLKAKEKKTEKPDYTKYSQIELVNAMRDMLKENDERDIKNDIEIIKAAFYKNLKENEEAAKKEFIEGGGAEEDFVAEQDPYENDIKDLIKEYRQLRIDYSKRLEVEKEENLQKKYEVIEKIKGLINNEESINKTFNEFRSLQQEWRDIGLVPQSEMKNLWDTYHFHVENFYDYIKINRELRDLDLKKNLEAKIKLCEKAEELLLDPSIIRAFNTLQKYHEQWREIGPVPREQKDDIWERFKAATTTINKKHQQFFEDRKLEQKKNLEAKTALCERVEAINELETDSHKEWDKISRELIQLQKVWRTIGFAPRKDNNKIYDRFRTACDKFFDAKRAFYSKNKEEQQGNLQLKIDLCVQAEALKDSTDWKKTTQDFINIQKQWKEIGPVPRKQSESVWKRFRTACDYFFDKKSEHFNDVDSEQVDNLELKESLIEEIKNFKSSKDVKDNLSKLKDFQRRWAEIGHVPFKKKDEIQAQFREVINKLYDDLNLDDEQRNLLKFRTKMSSYSESSRGQSKMRLERDKYMNKMKQLENDLVLLDNNIGFFAESKNAESLIKDVRKKIEVTKQKIEFLKEKIRVIDDIEDNE